MKALRYLPIVLLLSACGGQGKKNIGDTVKLSTTTTTAVTDTAYFDKPVAIVIEPSARLIEQKRSKLEGSAYTTVVTDNVYYLAQSQHYLDSVKANLIRRQSEGSVKFKTISGQTYEMKLDTLFFGVMLFNGVDKPVMADMTSLKGDYEKYMKK